MGKYFGTDGFRGEAGIILTADHAYKVGRFLGWYYNALRERNGDNEPARIVIGKDTRRSSYMFEYSLVAGLTASGADAYLLHVTTTPSVAYIARVDDFDCGIMISASHNPYYDNGIKLIDCYGEKMPEETLLLVEDYIDGNRGDEAAIRAMIDELRVKYPSADIYVQRALGEFGSFPENEHVKVLPPFPIGGKKRRIQEQISIETKGKINLTSGAKAFYKAINGADIVLHAPGGPSIGDIYMPQETIKLRRLLAVKKAGVPYAFYAPSMGPFKNAERNPVRKEILEGASLICLREDISAKMVKEFVPLTNPIVTLDSAFQHDIDINENEKKFNEYTELRDFVGNGQNVIGITITDLQWNSLYKGDGKTKENIRETFTEFIKKITGVGYKVLFIPQLFSEANRAFDLECRAGIF